MTCVECGAETSQELPVDVHPPGPRNRPYAVWSYLCSEECQQQRVERIKKLAGERGAGG